MKRRFVQEKSQFKVRAGKHFKFCRGEAAALSFFPPSPPITGYTVGLKEANVIEPGQFDRCNITLSHTTDEMQQLPTLRFVQQMRLPLPPSRSHPMRYSIPAPLRLWVFMGVGDNLLFGGSHTLLPLKHVIKNKSRGLLDQNVSGGPLTLMDKNSTDSSVALCTREVDTTHRLIPKDTIPDKS
ncbi:hypothetical protein EVAR_74345_1 [Eumeta japonica]|uniref:Uncharacterized protein n=1 Tax=Eumeta variegata TaxID=151549 RepID=A0A4C1SF48_EUMVA|nr:hypothetical protein EVAR_74345_1 [Eumeta japonica]